MMFMRGLSKTIRFRMRICGSVGFLAVFAVIGFVESVRHTGRTALVSDVLMEFTVEETEYGVFVLFFNVERPWILPGQAELTVKRLRGTRNLLPGGFRVREYDSKPSGRIVKLAPPHDLIIDWANGERARVSVPDPTPATRNTEVRWIKGGRALRWSGRPLVSRGLDTLDVHVEPRLDISTGVQFVGSRVLHRSWMLVAGLVVVFGVTSNWSWLRPIRRHQCPMCRYDLRGSVGRETGCPECGWNRAQGDDNKAPN